MSTRSIQTVEEKAYKYFIVREDRVKREYFRLLILAFFALSTFLLIDKVDSNVSFGMIIVAIIAGFVLAQEYYIYYLPKQREIDTLREKFIAKHPVYWSQKIIEAQNRK